MDFNSGSSRYRVFVDDELLSAHSTEREAAEAATNAALLSLDSSVHYIHDYRVDVNISRRDVLKAAVAAALLPPDTSEGAVVAVEPDLSGQSYTASHYVAPFASVSGASNDYDDLGATAWADAVSSGDPTTLGTAMARATAGNQVECASGVYISGSAEAAERQHGHFMPANSGSSGSPIIFYALHPAAENYGSTSLYTELRKHADLNVADSNGAALGTYTRNYIIFDGFYLNEQHNYPNGNGGQVSAFSGSTNCEFRRLAFDRYDRSYATNYNANCIYIDSTIDHQIVDCYFTGSVTTASHNNGAICIYNSANFLVKNNTFDATNNPVYSKESGIQPTPENDPDPYRTSGTISYNKFVDCFHSIELQQGITVNVNHNLIIDDTTTGTGDGAVHFDSGPDRFGDLTWTVENNTIVLANNNVNGFHVENILAGLTSCTFRNNIVYCGSAQASGYVVMTSAPDSGSITQWTWADFTINNNCYYAPTTIRWHGDTVGDVYTSLSSWQTETSQEANSITSDPEFNNAASNDYTLADNAQAALTASSTGGAVGCYVTGSEEIGVRSSPSY